MKRLLLVTLALSLSATVAAADHIGIYSDATGSSCYVAPGFTTTTAVVHKFSAGTTGVRFKVTFPAGSTYFAFNTPYAPTGSLDTDISVGYGTCLAGSIPIGTIVAILTVGPMVVVPADLQTVIQYTDCSFNELAASGGGVNVGTGDCTNATETSTWGKVKSLYR